MKVQELINVLNDLPAQLKKCDVAFRDDDGAIHAGDPRISMCTGWFCSNDPDVLGVGVLIDREGTDVVRGCFRVEPNHTAEDVVRGLTEIEMETHAKLSDKDKDDEREHHECLAAITALGR